ncbi:MAG TPA: hypothetical protein VJ799_03725 [Nitrososphaeraceae archaeon]|nr:hypothetical protein [Nitrososphaeraceae archaeon]
MVWNSSQNITHHPSVWLGIIAGSLSLQLTRRYDQLLLRRTNRLEEHNVEITLPKEICVDKEIVYPYLVAR